MMFGLLFFIVPDIMIALWCISGIIFMYRLAIIKTTEYALTTKRVVTKDGIFKRNICETALNKIEGINVNQSVIGRMFDFGHLVVTGTGGKKNVFPRIKQPFLFRKSVQEELEKNK